MRVYQTKAKKLSGTDFQEVNRKAHEIYTQIKKKSKRRPYVRSAYFRKEKIFLELFWKHLYGKENWRDRMRRLKYFACVIELIQKSRFAPTSKKNPNKSKEMLHRFYGLTADNELFCIQIKEDVKNKQKFLISVFPTDGPWDWDM
ncbi:MAG: hypothetical protein UX02_C0002G0409 [Candidatus Moranbacteria bacterium GW2011_GWC1_45_18]|nr:MAG: hypothetical protein UT79_C0001G0052 [Candidatus Moranbacteria bacterium GW2011_GWC2_40_12]KKT32684.1 MAG: hypothetical protein UW19_C0017G0022 [Candidatus Moranbacteria bacterium GW2011_GWF2_44_10]KKU00166.1 MAG: hypothetical protein UX02_C0002G0409 [Candidatus Moranbacteria bacterium GW2011_GWC1_45_18]OGI24081.1 MAG: hypothetical protein A2194_04125 [Candidatus Moranbacteria bacterium RIFOXYA1_FULL_44_8]OGI35226.1 MAG: hypothetical protein A2407_00720 [Candidatus Moranbacteria bacteri